MSYLGNVWAVEPIRKDENDEKLKKPHSVANEWSAFFIGLNWSLWRKNFKKFHLDRDFFSWEKWTSPGAIVL